MNAFLENDYLQVEVIAKGAELKSVVNKLTGLEYMWTGDPAFWGKTSPILFPIVGTLKDNSYLYQEKIYSLSRHGFARDQIFGIVEQKKDLVVFSLSGTDSTHEKYPFDFELSVIYQVMGDSLEVTYEVRNKGRDFMYFSIGGHPAFKVPLTAGTAYEDYYLEFNEPEHAPRWPINAEGLIKEQPTPFLNNSAILKLHHDLFKEDALVFKNLKSNTVSIRSGTHAHGLDFSFDGFPYLGIWAAKQASFVCIEPWCGLADSENHDQRLTTKEGIEKIGSEELWTRTWKVKFY
jgi:galactose mutarotase-like enzyme